MAYELEVPVGRAALWPAFTDPEAMARAVPGLTVDAVQPVEPAGPAGVSADVVAGRLRLKVGAGTVTYRGTATIAEADPAAGTLDIAVDVAQARGSGALAGYLRVALTPTGAGTLVSVVPELEVSGRAAEFRAEDLRATVGALAGAWVEALAAPMLAAGESPRAKPEVVAEIEAAAEAEAAAGTSGPEEPEESDEGLAAQTAEVQEPADSAESVEPEESAESVESVEQDSASTEPSDSSEAAEQDSESEEQAPESGEAEESADTAKPVPVIDDSLSGDPLDVVWRGEYDKNPWIPVVAVLAILLFLRRRRAKRRHMS